jgi:acetyl esterase
MTDTLTTRAGDDLDPAIARFIRETGEAYRQHADLASVSNADMRLICETVRAPWRQGGPRMASTSEREINTRHGPVRVRIHDPSTEQSKPALIYLHGGGWTFFSLDTHDRVMREYAARAGVVVIGVDYALSPEARFPVALEQTVDVALWLREAGAAIGVDPHRIAIGGDSAGGNLSFCASLMLRGLGRDDVIKAMVLNYPVLDTDSTAEYRHRFGGPAYMLTPDEMTVFWANYLTSPAERDNPLANPAKARLEGLPPTFLTIPECDLLSSQSLAMADRLKAAGVPTKAVVYPGASHSFLEAVSIAAVAGQAFDDAAAWLSETLSR